jgi:hypothetical protein
MVSGSGAARFILRGSDKFVETMQLKMSAQSMDAEIPRAQRRPLAKPLTHYRGTFDDAADAMAAAHATGHYSMRKIVDEFGVHYSTVSVQSRSGRCVDASPNRSQHGTVCRLLPIILNAMFSNWWCPMSGRFKSNQYRLTIGDA